MRFNFFAYDSVFREGVNVATGDVIGDAVDDIIIGAGVSGAQHVKVFDRLTGTEVPASTPSTSRSVGSERRGR